MSKEMKIEVITYEQERLDFFTKAMQLAQKRYNRLFKIFKDDPYLSEGTTMVSDAGRESQFYHDVVEMLENGNRKQSEWISVDDRLPEDDLPKDTDRRTIRWSKKTHGRCPTADVAPKSEVAREIFAEIEEGLQYEIDLEDKNGRNAWGEGDTIGFHIHEYAEDKLDTFKIALSLLKKKYTEEKE